MEETRKMYMKSEKNCPDFPLTSENEIKKEIFDQESYEISKETMNELANLKTEISKDC